MNLFEMKQSLATLQEGIRADADYITEKAADPTAKMEDIRAKEAHRKELQDRYDLLKAEHDRMEEAQRLAVAAKSGSEGSLDQKTALVRMKARFYRDAINGVSKGKAYEGLGAIPPATPDLGSGDKLLPTNLSRELLLEPVEKNPLREIVHITNVTGLEEPKLGFTIEDADIADVTDQQTANEIAMEGDTVSYGRMKTKVTATVKDTVYHGSDLDLVDAIENQLAAALAKREKHFAFLPTASCESDSTHAHMSFYNGTTDGVSGDVTYAIKSVTGANLYKAIVAALADLADDYAGNAKVVMRKVDYFSMIEGLANSAESLFGSKPASILGTKVVFCDKATIPVVGDFRYYGINYDIGTVYDTDKDAKAGEYYYVLTAWGDQQIRLKSAFRLAVVDAG